MKIEIMVRINSQYGTYAAAVEVPDYLVDAFAPMNTNDHPLFDMFNPGAVSHDEMQVVIKMRENAAEELSTMLTEHIMNAMKGRDTHNGYKIS